MKQLRVGRILLLTACITFGLLVAHFLYGHVGNPKPPIVDPAHEVAYFEATVELQQKQAELQPFIAAQNAALAALQSDCGPTLKPTFKDKRVVCDVPPKAEKGK
jgi:hypothetical protein